LESRTVVRFHGAVFFYPRLQSVNKKVTDFPATVDTPSRSLPILLRRFFIQRWSRQTNVSPDEFAAVHRYLAVSADGVQ
jgi:hypothetical protein